MRDANKKAARKREEKLMSSAIFDMVMWVKSFGKPTGDQDSVDELEKKLAEKDAEKQDMSSRKVSALSAARGSFDFAHAEITLV